MEENYLGMGGGIAGIVALVVAIAVKLNHKRLRSHCCGKDIEVSVDVENTTPIEKSHEETNAKQADVALQEVKSKE